MKQWPVFTISTDLQVTLATTNTEERKMYECCPVLASFDIWMLKMLPEMIQFTYISETEIAIIFQSKFQTQKSEANQHVIQWTEPSLLWFWMWQEQQFITSTFFASQEESLQKRITKEG